MLSEQFNLTEIQENLIKQVYNYYEMGKKSCLLYSTMGSGKTVVAAQIIADMVSQEKRVLFCCHRTKLITQVQQKLKNFYSIDAALIWADNKIDYSNNVQIATFQTLQKQDILPPDIDLCIFDEAHTTAYWQTSWKIMHHYSGGILPLSKCLFLGLTATPWRAKRTKEGFCQFYDCLVQGPDFVEMLSKSELTAPRHFGWNGLIDFSLLEVGADGDYTQASLDKVCDENLNVSIVEEYCKRFKDLKPVIFCGSVNQAKDLAQRFDTAGIKCGLVLGSTPESKRQKIYSNYANGKLRAICGVSVFAEGFDEASCDAVILARPTASLAFLFQMSGRALRKYPGKFYSYLLDFGENFHRLGYITQKHPVNLCPFERKLSLTNNLKTCPDCHAIVSKFASICPDCGYTYKGSIGKNIAVQLLSKTTENSQIKYGELLSAEQRKMLRYLRRQMWVVVERSIDPSLVTTLFFEKFRMLPPPEWFFGALFGGVNSFGNMQVYWQFLRRVRPNAPSWWYRNWMLMEFGNLDNHFDSEYNLNNQKSQKFDYKDLDWADYLGVDSNSSWENIVLQYRKLLKNASTSETLMANVALELAAQSLGKWDFVSKISSNASPVNENSYKAIKLADAVLQAVKTNNAKILKVLINQDLNFWQRHTIRLLTPQEFTQVTELLKTNKFNNTDDIFDEYLKVKQQESLVGKWIVTNSNVLYFAKSYDDLSQKIMAYSHQSDYVTTISLKAVVCTLSIESTSNFQVTFSDIKSHKWQQFVAVIDTSKKIVYQCLVFPYLIDTKLDLYIRKAVFTSVKDDFLLNGFLEKLINIYRQNNILNLRLIPFD